MSDNVNPDPAPETRPPPPSSASLPRPPVVIPNRSLFRLAFGFYGIVTLFALGYALFSGTLGTLFGTEPPRLAGILAGIGIGAAIVGITRIGYRTWPAIEDAAREMAMLLGPLSRRDAIALALLSGFAEELLFRGALWSHFTESPLLGTSLLFGLVHVLPRRALWGYPLFALGAGFLLGLLREGSGSVVPPMIGHMVINGLNLWFLSSKYEEFARLHAADEMTRPDDES